MTREEIGERVHGFADFAVLLATIGLALATWVCFAGSHTVPVWKPWLSMGFALVLALASLTRHQAWERQLKLAAGGWVIAAPFLLQFLHVSPARWTYFAAGLVMVAAARPVPGGIRRLADAT